MKKLTATVLAILMALSLAACGGKPAASSASGSAAAPASKSAQSAAEAVTLTLMNNWSAPNADNEIYKARVASFMKENPNIKVELETIPLESYFTTVQTAATGDQLADLVVVWPGYKLIPFVKAGKFAPIDEIMSSLRSYLPESTTYEYLVDGKQYAVPAKMNYTSTIYYSKSMLKEVGYDKFPTTYEDFQTLVQKLKAAGKTAFTMGNKDQWPMQSCLFSCIADRVTGSDFLSGVTAGTRKFTDDDFVSALTVLSDMSKAGTFNADMNTLDYTESQNYMSQGKTAIYMATSVVYGNLVKNNPNADDIGVAVFPAIAGGKGKGVSMVGAQNSGIAVNAKLTGAKKEAAMKFLQYFFAKDMYADMIKAGFLVPATVSTDNASAGLKALIGITSNGMSSVYDTVLPPSVITVLQNGLQSLTMGNTTPQALAKDLQAAMDKEKK